MPLFSRCEAADGSEVPKDEVRLRVVPPTKLHNHGMFEQGYPEPEVFEGTFEAGLMSAYTTAKVMGYLNLAEMDAWDELFKALMLQNPRVVKAEAHWFCSDLQIPFVMSFKRDDEGKQTQVFKGHEGHALWTKVTYDEDGDHEEGECDSFVFDDTMYATARAKHASFWQAMDRQYGLRDVPRSVFNYM